MALLDLLLQLSKERLYVLVTQPKVLENVEQCRMLPLYIVPLLLYSQPVVSILRINHFQSFVLCYIACMHVRVYV